MSNESMTKMIGHFERGNRFYLDGNFSAAAGAFSRAIKHDPHHVAAYVNLGTSLRQLKQYEGAKVAYERAITLQPDDASMLSNYGNLLVDMKLFNLAEDMHAKVLELGEDDTGFIYNAGVAPFHNNQPDRAIDLFDKVIEKDSQHLNSNWNRSLALLQKGDYIEGFKAYEWRLQRPDVPRREFEQPRWEGKSLKGKILLLTAEQGFGDMIQFARFIPQVAKKAKSVILECRPELARLMETVEGVDQIVVAGQPLPEHDFHVPLLSLPMLLKLKLAKVPSDTPYFKIEPTESRLIPAQQRPVLKVGLIWNGKLTPLDRGCPFELLIPLFQHTDVQFYSFQLGERREDIREFGCDAYIYDMAGNIRDFADTAAIVQHMDLVITIDSAIAHLTGALGIPTWLMLLHSSDWRWLLDRDDSPWYPSMKLFRQAQHNDWDDCVARLTSAFQVWCSESKMSSSKH